jgi:alcohol dehydrogenase
MDAAKGLAYLNALDGNEDDFLKALSSPDNHTLKNAAKISPLITIPTTSGTGSEVTRWATIWGDNGEKHSLSQYNLYPQTSIYDASLCLSMPTSVTLYSGLDALSHACEAIWNTNATKQSDEYACEAISLITQYLPLAMQERDNLEARSKMQLASYMAGCAMSLTRTALAHSISYPLTGKYDIPHGFACSFTLPEIARYNTKGNEAKCSLIAKSIDGSNNAANALEQLFSQLDLHTHLKPFFKDITPERLSDLELINPSRAGNNIREITQDDAQLILSKSLNAVIGNA